MARRSTFVRPRTVALLSTLALLGLAGLGSSCSDDIDDAVVVASLDDPESEALAHVYTELLEGTGVDAEIRARLGTRSEVVAALRAGEVALYPDASGEGLAFLDGSDDRASASVSATASRFRRRFREQGISVFDPALASRRAVVVVTFETAERTRIFEVSGLVGLGEPLVLAVAPGLRDAYDLPADRVVEVEDGRAALEALAAGDAEAAVVAETEGALAGSDDVVLVDDEDAQPANNIIPVARIEDRSLGEAVYRQLDRLAEELTTADVRELNRRTAIEDEAPSGVARDLLADKGLIPS